MQTSGEMRREIVNLYLRHCERSDAIHLSPRRDVDCIAALAMTWMGRGALDFLPVPVSSESATPSALGLPPRRPDEVP
jgi:hypothetical protein